MKAGNLAPVSSLHNAKGFRKGEQYDHRGRIATFCLNKYSGRI